MNKFTENQINFYYYQLLDGKNITILDKTKSGKTTLSLYIFIKYIIDNNIDGVIFLKGIGYKDYIHKRIHTILQNEDIYYRIEKNYILLNNNKIKYQLYSKINFYKGMDSHIMLFDDLLVNIDIFINEVIYTMKNTNNRFLFNSNQYSKIFNNTLNYKILSELEIRKLKLKNILNNGR